MRKHLYQVIGMLSTQFLLGMALNVIGEPEEGTATVLKVAAYIIITLHILLAFGLLAKGFQIWKLADSDITSRRDSRVGLTSISLAIVFGIMTVTVPGGEVWSYLMAASFLAAFLSYGRLLLRTTATA